MPIFLNGQKIVTDILDVTVSIDHPVGSNETE